MGHDCETCGQACYCDGEDTWFDTPPDDCSCDHDGSGLEADDPADDDPVDDET